ncbi:hypothetical protein O181_002188 [Austropuccinia psidii MF-1]|uniref:Retrotransposon gag domain-containing protein n=1 Tax=Austropuccinia psidii MF-1 TaxID=1389203 RepID=A0A9Q3GCE0_9BASI|nr:hypothetical protein [Austropuccinia psidii MF-1]
MPVQHSSPAKSTRSQRSKAVPTPTEIILFGEAEDKDWEESVEEEESEEPKVEAALEGAPEASEAQNIALYNQPLVSQAEPNFLKMMEKMTQLMGKITQAAAPREMRGFIQSCQLIFNNYPENFFSDRKKVLYSDSFPTGRAEKQIEPYLSNISNEDSSYLLNNWKFFEKQVFILFGDPNEVRKAEKELHNIRMKESGNFSLYIADFRSLISIIRDCGERAYIHVYRRGLASTLLDELTSHPDNFDSLQKIMDITLELDTRYHERQKKKGSNQKKKPPVTGSNSSRPT